MKLTKDQIRMLAKELTIETDDNDKWAALVRLIQEKANETGNRKLIARIVFSQPDERLFQIPTGATHYAVRRFADGPAIDFWRVDE